MLSIFFSEPVREKYGIPCLPREILQGRSIPIHFLDELVDEMLNPEDPEIIADNYNRNSVYIARLLGDVQVFISMLGFPEEKYLTRFIF